MWYLRIGDDSLEEAEEHPTKQFAVWAFQRVAEQLARYGQEIEASLHKAKNRDEVVEYPDYVLALGPRGGIKIDRC